MKHVSKSKVYYLVSPFTHPDPTIEYARYLEQQEYHACLIKDYGLNIIAPIESCYHLHNRFNLSGGYEFWKKRDRKFISISDGIIVCQMEGLDSSVGCQDEIAYAKLLNKEIHYINSNIFKKGAQMSQAEEKVELPSGCMKDMKTKLDLSLVPYETLESFAKAGTIGIEKGYPKDNWRKGTPYSVAFASMLRHLYKWFSGEDENIEIDPQSGQPVPTVCHHLDNVIWWAATTKYQYNAGRADLDDRQKGPRTTSVPCYVVPNGPTQGAFLRALEELREGLGDDLDEVADAIEEAIQEARNELRNE